MLSTFSIIKNKAGSALLIALLVMAGLITVSAGTASLVVNEIRQAKNLDKAIIAYYAAESGVEKALYQSRQNQMDLDLYNGFEETLGNGAGYTLITNDSQQTVYTAIKEDQIFQLDLYKPGSLQDLSTPIKSIKVQWTNSSTAQLEAVWGRWTSSGNLSEPQATFLLWQSGGTYINLTKDTINDPGPYLYVIRLIARTDDINDLSITAYSQFNPETNCVPISSCQVDLPNQITIKGVGEYPVNKSRQSRQAITATMPVRSPMSGMFDYVIYAEEDLIKEF